MTGKKTVQNIQKQHCLAMIDGSMKGKHSQRLLVTIFFMAAWTHLLIT